MCEIQNPDRLLHSNLNWPSFVCSYWYPAHDSRSWRSFCLTTDDSIIQNRTGWATICSRHSFKRCTRFHTSMPTSRPKFAANSCQALGPPLCEAAASIIFRGSICSQFWLAVLRDAPNCGKQHKSIQNHYAWKKHATHSSLPSSLDSWFIICLF